MTPTQIEQLARQAGALDDHSRIVVTADGSFVLGLRFTPDELARFVGLVRAAALEEAAQECERNALLRRLVGNDNGAFASECCTSAVRALAQQADREAA